MNDIKTVAVAGAGTMGAGIAQVFAQAGFAVKLFDVNEEQLKKAATEIEQNLLVAIQKGKLDEAQKIKAQSNLTYTADVSSLKVDLIIEAIVERLEVKRDLFQKLAAVNSADCILASNTSSLSITQIAKEIPHPNRVVGMHFFNPAHLMKLVELVKAIETTEEVIEILKELCSKIGKTTVVCKDSPGFIVNRVARHYYVESLKTLEENIASPEKIDALLESAGFKMGAFKLMDTIGNDINFAVTTSLYTAFHQDPKFRPSRIQQQKVEAGHLGKKTGKGFYDYSK